MPVGAEQARREAQIQDPYPDETMGPPVGDRPREFIKQRSEPQQVRDRFYSGFLKSHFGTQRTPQQPIGPEASYPGYYPGIVR